MGKRITTDSRDYRQTFYGILNGDGDFWTPLAFETERAARNHIINFWGKNTEYRDRCLRLFKIVPVRVRLSAEGPSKSPGDGR